MPCSDDANCAPGGTCVDLRDPEANPTILSGDLNGDDLDVACRQDSPDCDSFGGLCLDGFCIISDNNAENSHHVVTGSGTISTAAIDGFTITSGNADPVSFPNNSGAGMFAIAGSPTVSNCTISGNSADVGSGMYNTSGSNPIVSNCTFTGNVGDFFGGGMSNRSSSPVVINCTFDGNSGSSGGGMFNQPNSSPTVTGCVLGGNTAQGGGGMHNQTNSNPTLVNCKFIGNSATAGAGRIRCPIGWGNASRLRRSTAAIGNANTMMSRQSPGIGMDCGRSPA